MLEKFKESPQLFSLGLHQIAMRSAGIEIPPYEENIDVVHRCGFGRKPKRGDSDNYGCFNPKHLALASHQQNMDAQKCLAKHKCSRCGQVDLLCNHEEPFCISTTQLENAYTNQDPNKKVAKIVIHYDDGSKVVMRNK